MKRHYFELEPGSALEDGLSGGRVKVAKYQGKRVRLRRQWMNPPGRSLHGTPDHAWTILESRLRSSIDHVKKRRHHGSMICAVAAGCLPTQGILTGHIDGTITYTSSTQEETPTSRINLGISQISRLLPVGEHMGQALFACQEGVVGTYDFLSEKIDKSIRPMHNGEVLHDCDMSGSTLVTVGDSHIITFDLRTGYCEARFDCGNSFTSCSSVRFGPPARDHLLLVVSNVGPLAFDMRQMSDPLYRFTTDNKDATTQVAWNKATASFDTVFHDHAVPPFHIQYLDENHAITSSAHDEHKIWSLVNGKGVCTLSPAGTRNDFMNAPDTVPPCISLSRKVIYSVDSQSQCLHEWSFAKDAGFSNRAPTRVLYKSKFPVTSAALSTDWSMLVLADTLGKTYKLSGF